MLYPDTPEGLIATGFLAAGPWHYVGQASPRDFFYLAYRSPQAKAASASEGRLATSSKP